MAKNKGGEDHEEGLRKAARRRVSKRRKLPRRKLPAKKAVQRGSPKPKRP